MATTDRPDPEPDWAEFARKLKAQMPVADMDEGRAAALRSILDRVEQAAEEDDPFTSVGRTRALMREFAPLHFDPTRSEPLPALPGGARAAALLDHVRTLHAAHTAELTRLRSFEDGAGEAAFEFLGRLREAREVLLTAQVADLPRIEREVLRPIGRDARAYALRRHLTVARPIWASTSVNPDPNAVFCAAGEQVADLVQQVCTERGLRCHAATPQREPATARWEQLRGSALGVFDFTDYSRAEPLPAAAISYELGMALATGLPVVVVIAPDRELPFDINVDPVVMGDGGDDLEALASALDAALYGVHRGDHGDSIPASLHWLREHCESIAAPVIARLLDERVPAGTDATTTWNRLESILPLLDDPPTMLLPAMPGRYPDPAAPLCFHVTAFRAPAAEQTRALLRQVCGQKIVYRRGDEARAQDVIGAIWDDLGCATHIVVDLTGLNANVLIELGIAHVLGRTTQLISQDKWYQQVPTIAKYRCVTYSPDEAGLRTLGRAVTNFLYPDEPEAAVAPVPSPATLEPVAAEPVDRKSAVPDPVVPLPRRVESRTKSLLRAGIGAARSAGAALREHLGFIDRAYRLPADAVPAALEQYVASLSEPGKAGLQMTLLVLARQEKNPQRRAFVRTLAGLAPEPPAAQSAPAPVCPPTAPLRSVPLDGPEVSFDMFADVFDTWTEMPEGPRRREIAAYLSTLPPRPRCEVAALAARLAKVADTEIAEHEARKDEAWGGFIEDRLSYGFARLRTGQSDPRWVERHRELQTAAETLQMVIDLAS
jgi:hypothetical protein